METSRKLISTISRGGRRISSSISRSQRPFGYFLPIASYGTIFAAKWSNNSRLEAVVSKWLAQGHKGLTAHRCSFYFCFSPPNALFFVIDHTTKLGMKDSLKDQQWWVQRYSNLIPPQYRPNALSTAPCSTIIQISYDGIFRYIFWIRRKSYLSLSISFSPGRLSIDIMKIMTSSIHFPYMEMCYVWFLPSSLIIQLAVFRKPQ